MTTYLTDGTSRLWVGDHAPLADESGHISAGTIDLFNFYRDASNNTLYQVIGIDPENPNQNLLYKKVGEFPSGFDLSILTSLNTGAHINDAVTNSPTDAPTNLNVVSTLLGQLTGQVNSTNQRQNEIAINLNNLATKFNTLLDRLEANNLLAIS